MTLQNLVRIGRLKPHSPTPQEIRRLLAAAERNLTDARVGAICVLSGARFSAFRKSRARC